MKPILKKPGSAVTASAMDPFEVSEEDLTILAKLNGEGHYIGSDGDRLFTRNEVTIILKRRLERYKNNILSKYQLSSMHELDALILLASKIKESVRSYNATIELMNYGEKE